MRKHSHSISVMASFSMIVCCAYLISSSPLRPESNRIDRFPTGESSPEGAACDLMRAYISQNVSLFHKRRCKTFCENSFDHANAYKTFIKHEPQALTKQPNSFEQFARPTRIVTVLPAQHFLISDEEANSKEFQLFINDGACESKFVDITTVSNTGKRYITRVETIHIGKYGSVKNSQDYKGRYKIIPTGVWKARIIQLPLQKTAS